VVPILPVKQQQFVRQRYEESRLARRRADKLLQCAKRAVELAIGDAEVAALKFLKENC
jgi:hypothetical protein